MGSIIYNYQAPEPEKEEIQEKSVGGATGAEAIEAMWVLMYCNVRSIETSPLYEHYKMLCDMLGLPYGTTNDQDVLDKISALEDKYPSCR
jgi:hypothetical protein